MPSSTSSIAARTSSRIVRYWAFRSTSGMSVLVITVMSCWSPSTRPGCSRPSCLHIFLLEPAVRVREDAGEAGKLRDLILELDRRVAGPHAARWHLLAHDAAGADQCVGADLDARQDRAVRADPRALPDDATTDAIEVRRTHRVRVVRE